MPYISRDRRKMIIRNGLGDLWAISDHLELGDLAYIVFTLLVKYAKRTERYDTYARVLGLLESVKNEIERRLLNPYEDHKIHENGDTDELED